MLHGVPSTSSFLFSEPLFRLLPLTSQMLLTLKANHGHLWGLSKSLGPTSSQLFILTLLDILCSHKFWHVSYGSLCLLIWTHNLDKFSCLDFSHLNMTHTIPQLHYTVSFPLFTSPQHQPLKFSPYSSLKVLDLWPPS